MYGNVETALDTGGAAGEVSALEAALEAEKAKEPPPTAASSPFLIYNQHHSGCVVATGPWLSLAPCAPSSPSQLFQWLPGGLLRHAASGRCAGASAEAAGALLRLGPCRGGRLQRWACGRGALLALGGSGLFFNFGHERQRRAVLYGGTGNWSRWLAHGSRRDVCSRAILTPKFGIFPNPDPKFFGSAGPGGLRALLQLRPRAAAARGALRRHRQLEPLAGPRLAEGRLLAGQFPALLAGLGFFWEFLLFLLRPRRLLGEFQNFLPGPGGGAARGRRCRGKAPRPGPAPGPLLDPRPRPQIQLGEVWGRGAGRAPGRVSLRDVAELGVRGAPVTPKSREFTPNPGTHQKFGNSPRIREFNPKWGKKSQ
ncbi:uncharacterized protein [Taeniopygia guttata]|uniref:uncharacterized protein isoform X2 n=1 Tax=Taeniopygia guttata TaxID=59729 RepID=UPI003BB8CA1A